MARGRARVQACGCMYKMRKMRGGMPAAYPYKRESDESKRGAAVEQASNQYHNLILGYELKASEHIFILILYILRRLFTNATIC